MGDPSTVVLKVEVPGRDDIKVLLRRETLQEILDIVLDLSESYPSQDRSQDFFEVHWDFAEELAGLAERLGMRPSHEQEEEEDAPEEG